MKDWLNDTYEGKMHKELMSIEDAMENSMKPKQNKKLTDTQEKIKQVCDNLKEFLLEKNRRYGDSALNPIRIYSKADTKEQILVRIDDKLNRIRNKKELRKNDLVDNIGYHILLLVHEDWTTFDELLD